MDITNKQIVCKVYFHGYTRINKWFIRFVYMDIHEYTNGLRGLFTWLSTNKQMVYEVYLHEYARINKWFMTFIYMDLHE